MTERNGCSHTGKVIIYTADGPDELRFSSADELHGWRDGAGREMTVRMAVFSATSPAIGSPVVLELKDDNSGTYGALVDNAGDLGVMAVGPLAIEMLEHALAQHTREESCATC